MRSNRRLRPGRWRTGRRSQTKPFHFLQWRIALCRALCAHTRHFLARLSTALHRPLDMFAFLRVARAWRVKALARKWSRGGRCLIGVARSALGMVCRMALARHRGIIFSSLSYSTLRLFALFFARRHRLITHIFYFLSYFSSCRRALHRCS